MLTGRQIREARLLLGWTPNRLATASRLPLNTVLRAEMLDNEAMVTMVHADLIRRALEQAGIEFISTGRPA